MSEYVKNKKLAEGLTPGVWSSGPEGTLFSCPICGHVSNLEAYSVSTSGVVTPEFKCLAEGCAFTQGIFLSSFGT